MSLRRGKDFVEVILRENVPGERGRPVPREIGRVKVLGRIQESSTDDITAMAAAGEKGVLHIKRFICASFPGDDLSQIVDARGALWDVVGEPKRHIGSRRTRRDEVRIRQTGVVRGVPNGDGL